MYSFDDRLDELDELGEDFGIINTPSFIRHKWMELNTQWEALVRPYAEIGVGTVTPPNFLKTEFLIWRNAYIQFKENFAFWPSNVSIWEDEAARYKRVYDRLEALRTSYLATPNADPLRTPSPADSGAVHPSQIVPVPKLDPEDPANKKSFLEMLVDDVGSYVLIIGGAYLAYNVFFRLKEGPRRVKT